MKAAIRQIGNRTDVVNARYVALRLGYLSQTHLMQALASHLGCVLDRKNTAVMLGACDVADINEFLSIVCPT